MSLVGRLEDLALPDIFQIISLSKKTGSLIVRSKRGTGLVVFKDGQVIQAANDTIREPLGNILVSQGMLDAPTLTRALARQKQEPDKPLGMLLVELGAIEQQILEGAIRKQIEEIVYDLLAWEEGFFNFELGEVAPKDAIEVNTQDFLLRSGINTEFLLMEGTRILDERRKGRAKAAPGAEKPGAPFQPVRMSSEPVREEFRARIETEEPSRQITTLKSMFDELRFPTATAEVTLLILRYASEVLNRAVLFMVKKDEVRGLGQFGIELKGPTADQVVRNIRIPLNKPSVFLTVIENRRSFVGALEQNENNDYLLQELGGARPGAVAAIPLIVDGKVALVVYGDNLPERRAIAGIDTLEIFMNQAGMALEKALLEKRLSEMEKGRR